MFDENRTTLEAAVLWGIPIHDALMRQKSKQRREVDRYNDSSPFSKITK